MSKNAKTNAAELEKRVNEIYMLLLRSEPREKILQYVAEKWGGSVRTGDSYIKRAGERMQEALEVSRNQALAKAVAQREDLYRLSYQDRKWWHCLEIARDRDQLLGLYYNLADHVAAVERAGLKVRMAGAATEDAAATADRAAAEFFSEEE